MHKQSIRLLSPFPIIWFRTAITWSQRHLFFRGDGAVHTQVRLFIHPIRAI